MPSATSAECFALSFETAPRVGPAAGHTADTLVLSTITLPADWVETIGHGGRRAFLDLDEWRQPGPVRSSSFYWLTPAPDSVLVAIVMPMAGITYAAHRTGTTLEGIRTFTSDAVGEPERAIAFTGERIRCDTGTARAARPTPLTSTPISVALSAVDARTARAVRG
ncbi:MAG TPA: hypothetical protein VF188_07575 [Longimicrobiales bacterium]